MVARRFPLAARIQLFELSRGDGGADGAGNGSCVRAAGDSPAARAQSRADGAQRWPQRAFIQIGHATMGGALILIGIAASVLLWANLDNRFVWVVMAVTMGFGWIGWVDDYRKIVHQNPRG